MAKKVRKNPIALQRRMEMKEEKVSIAKNFAKRLAFIRQILKERDIFEHEFAAFLVVAAPSIWLEEIASSINEDIR